MDIEKEIFVTKELRKDIDEIIQRVKSLNQNRETSLTITKLQEGAMWLDMNLKRLVNINSFSEDSSIGNVKLSEDRTKL